MNARLDEREAEAETDRKDDTHLGDGEPALPLEPDEVWQNGRAISLGEAALVCLPLREVGRPPSEGLHGDPGEGEQDDDAIGEPARKPHCGSGTYGAMSGDASAARTVCVSLWLSPSRLALSASRR